MQWIKWKACGNGIEDYGDVDPREVDDMLRRNELRAWNTLKATGADHVLYGMKIYDGNDRLTAVHLYMWEFDDEAFYKLPGRVHNAMIYALHRR